MQFSSAARATFLATISVALSTSTARAFVRIPQHNHVVRRAIGNTAASSASCLNSKRKRELALLTEASKSRWSSSSNGPPLSVRGGSTTLYSSATETSSSTAVAEETSQKENEEPKEIFRSSYRPLPYVVSHVNMNFDIRDGETVVTTDLTVRPNAKATAFHCEAGDDGNSNDLILDGEAEALELLSIELNGKELVKDKDFRIEGDALIVPSALLPPLAEGVEAGDQPSVVITTKVKIVPETNTQLSVRRHKWNLSSLSLFFSLSLWFLYVLCHEWNHIRETFFWFKYFFSINLCLAFYEGTLQIRFHVLHPMRSNGIPSHHLLPGSTRCELILRSIFIRSFD